MSKKPYLVTLAEQRRLGALQVIEETGDEGESGAGELKPDHIDLPGALRDETRLMEIRQRELEQSGHRQYGRVNAREKDPNEPRQGNEMGMGNNNIKQHPLLQNQRFDGVDSNLNPAPPDNPDALAQFENERQEQERQKQLRLGNELKKRRDYQPGMTPRPM